MKSDARHNIGGKKTRKKLIIMDVIIVILVVLNAAVIIAVTEGHNDNNSLWSSYRLMECYKNGEYGKAVNYTSRNEFILDDTKKADDSNKELYESMAVADYYKANFYRKVYGTSGNSSKADSMAQLSDDAAGRMGSLAPLKKRIDNMIK